MLWAAAAALAASLVVGLAGGAEPGLALAPWGMLAALALADLALSRPYRQGLRVSAPLEVFLGEEAEITLVATPARAGMRVRPGWPLGLEGPAEQGFAGDSARLTLRALRRGLWRLEGLWLIWPSRWGFWEFAPRREAGVSLRVLPNLRPVTSGQISATALSTLYGVEENRAIGEGAEFHQLRDFLPGMDIGSIDWKRSARSRSLLAREMRAERNHHLILVLDTGYLMGGEVAGLMRLDHAIHAALALAWAAAVGGDLVGYFSYDLRPRGFAPPLAGRQAFGRMRSWSADLTPSPHDSNPTLALAALHARTPKRSLAVLFTDFVDSTSAELMVEAVGLMVRRHLVVFVALRDPELERLASAPAEDLEAMARLVAAAQALQERRQVMERLTRLGVTVLDVPPHLLTARLVSTYLDIKARDLI